MHKQDGRCELLSSMASALVTKHDLSKDPVANEAACVDAYVAVPGMPRCLHVPRQQLMYT